MKDAISIQRVETLHPKYRPIVVPFIDEVEAFTGLIWRIDQAFRSLALQASIWAEGRTIPGPIVTWSPAGSSYHNYGLAVDIVPLNPDGSIDWHYNYEKIKDIAIKHGLGCGIDFQKPDYDHFEDRFGYNWRDLLHKYTIKDFIPGTEFVNI